MYQESSNPSRFFSHSRRRSPYWIPSYRSADGNDRKDDLHHYSSRYCHLHCGLRGRRLRQSRRSTGELIEETTSLQKRHLACRSQATGRSIPGGSCYPQAVPIILFALLFFVLLAVGGVVLLSLALRYRAGTARRQGRRWVASLNVWMTSLSAVLFLSFTFVISFWLSTAFRFALIGMGFGGILGLLGLAITRWESQPQGLFYTPSRCLALLVTLAIAARFVYGWWHATHSGSSAPGDQHWLVTASGTQLSLAVAAGLIGYYLVYSIGVRLQVTRHEQRRAN